MTCSRLFGSESTGTAGAGESEGVVAGRESDREDWLRGGDMIHCLSSRALIR
jgi:hypothetical protein